MLHCSMGYYGTRLWPVDLPRLGDEVKRELGELMSPSGDNYTLVDLDRTGPLMRYRTALFVYLDRVVTLSNISSLLEALHASLSPGVL